MGGCRCSYKNCRLRTDGVTHMFHYPVFDKMRCHQWLTNAQKLEFLNLKVSQLKNRVVCQHHFKDDNFMNFLKDKLTFDAVPTEDGPFCDSSQLSGKNHEQEDSKLYTISLEDIENEYLTFNDKKANFSVKYGDFLTNCDLMDLDSLNLANDNTQIITKDKSSEEPNELNLNDNIVRKKNSTMHPILNTTLDTIQPLGDNIYRIHVAEVPVEMDRMLGHLVVPACPTPNVPQITNQKNNIQVLTHKAKELPTKKNNKTLSKDTSKKITILDEQKISEPVPLPEKLKPVSPSEVLPLPVKRKNLNHNLTDNNNKHTYMEEHNTIAKFDAPDLLQAKNVLEQTTRLEKVIKSDEINEERIDNMNNVGQANNGKNGNVDSPTTQRNVNNRANIKKPNNVFIKNKIPPERMAAIEEKRKFNMKLRDIIASCLDKLDDEEDNNKSKLKSKIEQNITQKVSSYLAKEPELPSVHDYTVVYLEARMKKMENILLNKIDQNTQRIVELKKTLAPSTNRQSVYTQTALTGDLQKKHLYQEISQYLSPEVNSLLYEELFINKYTQKKSHGSPKKKRKCR